MPLCSKFWECLLICLLVGQNNFYACFFMPVWVVSRLVRWAVANVPNVTWVSGSLYLFRCWLNKSSGFKLQFGMSCSCMQPSGCLSFRARNDGIFWSSASMQIAPLSLIQFLVFFPQLLTCLLLRLHNWLKPVGGKLVLYYHCNLSGKINAISIIYFLCIVILFSLTMWH